LTQFAETRWIAQLSCADSSEKLSGIDQVKERPGCGATRQADGMRIFLSAIQFAASFIF
jgi:hypothetical protein